MSRLSISEFKDILTTMCEYYDCFFTLRKINTNKIELIIESSKSYNHIGLKGVLFTTSNKYISCYLKLYTYEDKCYIQDEKLFLESIQDLIKVRTELMYYKCSDINLYENY